MAVNWEGKCAAGPGCPCAPVTEGKHADAAGGKGGKWRVGLHCERFRVREQGCVVAITVRVLTTTG